MQRLFHVNMTRLHRQIIVPLLAVMIAACVPAPTPASPSPTPVLPTNTSLPATPTGVPEITLSPAEASPEGTDRMKIRLKLENTELTATLIDSKTTQDFLALLPLTLTLEDYGSTEKISYLPKRLSTEDAPAGIDPSVGDITYYAPWGNLAIFIRDFEYSSGLVLLGKIDGDVEALNVSGPISVTIEMIQ